MLRGIYSQADRSIVAVKYSDAYVIPDQDTVIFLRFSISMAIYLLFSVLFLYLFTKKRT